MKSIKRYKQYVNDLFKSDYDKKVDSLIRYLENNNLDLLKSNIKEIFNNYSKYNERGSFLEGGKPIYNYVFSLLDKCNTNKDIALVLMKNIPLGVMSILFNEFINK